MFVILIVNAPNSFSENFEAFTSNQIYSKEQILFVYGQGAPNENLIIRLFEPDETIAKFDQITTDDKGAFHHALLTWPEESTDFPFGTYTVEIISTQQGLSKKIDLKFTSTSELIEVPVERQLNVLVFAPETTAVGNPIRVFVQTTSDGLLIGNTPTELLGTTHVHLPSGVSVQLSSSFKTLHQGLYYVDYTPVEEGTHVFHVVAFSQGTTSHGSVATSVISQDLGGISEDLLDLSSVLKNTSDELDTLQSEIKGFDTTLKHASSQIDENIGTFARSAESISESSAQLNALLLPIIASIGLIVALQVTILARRR